MVIKKENNPLITINTKKVKFWIGSTLNACVEDEWKRFNKYRTVQRRVELIFFYDPSEITMRYNIILI